MTVFRDPAVRIPPDVLPGLLKRRRGTEVLRIHSSGSSPAGVCSSQTADGPHPHRIFAAAFLVSEAAENCCRFSNARTRKWVCVARQPERTETYRPPISDLHNRARSRKASQARHPAHPHIRFPFASLPNARSAPRLSGRACAQKVLAWHSPGPHHSPARWPAPFAGTALALAHCPPGPTPWFWDDGRSTSVVSGTRNTRRLVSICSHVCCQ